MTAFVGNTNMLTLVGLTSNVTETAITDATVTVTVQDADGNDVTGETWPLTMEHVSGGDYRAVLTDDLSLTAGTQYTAVIDADAGADRVGHWEFLFKPYTRRGRTVST